eukprot:s147_g5.t1
MPTRAVFKVLPHDIEAVYLKLLESQVACLIPVEQALKDAEGNLISGGLFAVPHKAQSDRVKEELLWMGLCLPTMHSNIRWPVSTRIGDPILSTALASMPVSERAELQKRKSNREIHKRAKEHRHAHSTGTPVPLPEQSDVEVKRSLHPAKHLWTFREIFAGKGGLTEVFRHKGHFQVGNPLALFQRGRPVKDHDILHDPTFEQLCRDASHAKQIWHFGLPCGSFSILQGLGNGTRNKIKPEGTGVLDREVAHNEILHRTCYLCLLLLEHGSFFTLENPRLSKYSPAYRSRLIEGGNHLCKFLSKEALTLKTLLRSKPATVDVNLEQYVADAHQQKTDGKMLRTVKHAVLFIQVLRPDLKHNLKRSWETLKSWEEAIPSGLRTPLPLCILMSMMCQARIEAMNFQHLPRMEEKWFAFSVLLGLGYFGLLRPGELLSLERRHIDLANSLTFAQPAVTIAIERPKNFRHLGTSQFVSVKQADVCNWTAWLCGLRGPKERLWPYSHAEFRRLFRLTCQSLLIQPSVYSPASLRAGGSTYYFDETLDAGRLRLMGRWSSLQTVEHYVQVGKSQQLLQTMSAQSIRRVKTMLREGNFLLSLPAAKASTVAPRSLIETQGWSDHGKNISYACRRWARMGEENEKSTHLRRAAQRLSVR